MHDPFCLGKCWLSALCGQEMTSTVRCRKQRFAYNVCRGLKAAGWKPSRMPTQLGWRRLQRNSDGVISRYCTYSPGGKIKINNGHFYGAWSHARSKSQCENVYKYSQLKKEKWERERELNLKRKGKKETAPKACFATGIKAKSQTEQTTTSTPTPKTATK